MLQFTTRLCKRLKIGNVNIVSLRKLSKNIYHDYSITTMQQKRKLRSFNANFSAKLKVIGSGALGAPACVYFLSDHINYLFNCGEGTQRLSQEHHCKLSKTEHIFVTNLSWKNIGGIPGLLLTAQHNGLRTIKIHSPEGSESFIDIIKTFTYYPNLEISHSCIHEHEVYKDNIMTVSYVPITKSIKHIEECPINSENESQCQLNVNGKRHIDVEMEETDEEINVEKKRKCAPNVICYICEVHPRRGKLLIDKCIDYGIPPGPLYNQLKQGLDVVKEDGTVVCSKDVCLPDSPKTTFIVAECPTEEYLDSFVDHPAFMKYQQSTSNAQKSEVLCIFHFTPETVLTNPKYQDWMRRFHSVTDHIILNDKNNCMGSEAVYKNQYLLNMLHPEIFPLLNKCIIQEDKNDEKSSIYRARAIQTLDVRPQIKRTTTLDIYNVPEMYINEVLQIPAFVHALTELKTAIGQKIEELSLGTTSDFPRIVMLGTGCSVPNKIRNTSGILLRLDKDSSILLDCGEGTLGQIIRLYGIPESDKILCGIKAIYVSHIHADHHLGLIGLLLRRKQITNDKLYLLIPKPMINWLNFYNDRFESISQQYVLINNSNLYLDYHKLSTTFENTFYDLLKVKEINTVYVAHCRHSYGISLTLNDNRKIVYSGDTMFSQNLVRLGKDCDLLIHEATMESGLEELATKKLHSTTSGAINAGKFMNAKFTLLTHFSQRYSKIPALSEKETNVGLAYDNMEVKLPQLPLLPLFYPCIKIMFSNYYKALSE